MRPCLSEPSSENKPRVIPSSPSSLVSPDCLLLSPSVCSFFLRIFVSLCSVLLVFLLQVSGHPSRVLP
ncbi:hypothetical protein RvY_02346 [Ramazzottius varieornatus]|uniref:Uncharacterized protein n=1 Tax=Ramazzottius varieornatus TaxID=947166 RepID=A0A1D1UJC9_RAMVA|nr:hypothetical protein RvY_02346 [Ramazzottius varieornatus]